MIKKHRKKIIGTIIEIYTNNETKIITLKRQTKPIQIEAEIREEGRYTF